jgi:hypothetical protein
MKSTDIEVVLGGLLTGAFIGFLWHPAASLGAMLTMALVVFAAGGHDGRRA